MENLLIVNIASYIEHTLLKPYALNADIEKLCNEAKEHQFFGVCVTPYQVKNAKKFLKQSKVQLITVVGFPFGYNHTPAKVEEVKKVIDAGADEIDMVMNISALRNLDYSIISNDIESVAMAVHMNNKVIKVIIESGVLTNEEIIKACEICTQAGVNFIKTSTGYAENGASVEAVSLIRKNTPEKIKIKASGGIKDKTFALQLIEAGADRIGTSSGIQIIAN